MKNPHAAKREFGHQLLAYAETLYSDGDPRAIRLMDELRKVAHQLYQLNETSLEAADLSYAQYRVLMSLSFNEWMGNDAGLNPSEISARQGTSRNTISALIRSLEDSGLIERQLDRDDRRRFYIRLTETGRQIVRDHANRHMQLAANIFAVLNSDELDTLSELLHKLNQCAQVIREEKSSSSGGSHASNR
jgi:DNA-binding MarR family transcriptional regulator